MALAYLVVFVSTRLQAVELKHCTLATTVSVLVAEVVGLQFYVTILVLVRVGQPLHQAVVTLVDKRISSGTGGVHIYRGIQEVVIGLRGATC